MFLDEAQWIRRRLLNDEPPGSLAVIGLRTLPGAASAGHSALYRRLLTTLETGGTEIAHFELAGEDEARFALVKCDEDEAPAPEHGFDAVLAVGLPPHQGRADLPALAKLLRSLLAPAGRLYLTTPLRSPGLRRHKVDPDRLVHDLLGLDGEFMLRAIEVLRIDRPRDYRSRARDRLRYRVRPLRWRVLCVHVDRGLIAEQPSIFDPLASPPG